MKEQSLGVPVRVLGYPIALAIMIMFYASEALHTGLYAVRRVLVIDPAEKHK